MVFDRCARAECVLARWLGLATRTHPDVFIGALNAEPPYLASDLGGQREEAGV
jgi:hypothetical protein